MDSAALGAALTPALAADRRFALPLALGAGLLVEAALAELGVEPRPLDLALEAPQGPLEALVVLDGHFQGNHAPRLGKTIATDPKYTVRPGGWSTVRESRLLDVLFRFVGLLDRLDLVAHSSSPPLHAHPGPTRQVRFRAMQLLPQAFPVRQIRQQTRGGGAEGAGRA